MAHFTYMHNLDPFAIAFTETIGIRWYGLSYVVGFIVAYYSILWISNTSRISYNPEIISRFMNYCIIGILVGGRLGYCLFYQPHLLTQLDSSFPFWGVLEIHKGGMASHGGILGTIVAIALFSIKQRFSLLHTLDVASIGVGIGIFLGRIANFINGELYGRVVEGKIWLGIQFPKEIYSWLYNWDQDKLLSLKPVLSYLKSVPLPFNRNQTMNLSESLWVKWVQSDKKFIPEIQSVLTSILQNLEEGRVEVIQAMSQILSVRHPSQLYQALLEGLLPALLVYFLWWRRPRIPGLIATTWAASYLLMRIGGEFFREPDVDIGFQALGLTRGQWLSLVLIIPVAMTSWYAWYSYNKSVKLKTTRQS